MVWCQNRDVLSGSNNTMVYTEFTVEADARFGDYNVRECNKEENGKEPQDLHASAKCVPLKQTRVHTQKACNPDNKTGIFSCSSWGSAPADLPRECAAGFDLEHEDCLNGTVLARMETDQGSCCSACGMASIGTARRGWWTHCVFFACCVCVCV